MYTIYHGQLLYRRTLYLSHSVDQNSHPNKKLKIRRSKPGRGELLVGTGDCPTAEGAKPITGAEPTTGDRTGVVGTVGGGSGTRTETLPSVPWANLMGRPVWVKLD
jgi:hypothetical protein